MKLIERKFYLQQLINVMNTPDIKVITGIRRSGKSKLMDAFIDYVQKQSVDNNIIRIKLNLKEFESLKNADALYKHINECYVDGKEKMKIFNNILEIFKKGIDKPLWACSSIKEKYVFVNISIHAGGIEW